MKVKFSKGTKIWIAITLALFIPTLALIAWAWSEYITFIPAYHDYVPKMIYNSTDTTFPVPFNFDNDWVAQNNAADYTTIGGSNIQPAVYARVIERENYVIYNYLFYYAFQQFAFVNYHEHDTEQVFVFVSKATQEPFILVSSAHGGMFGWNAAQVSSKADLYLFVEDSHASAHQLTPAENGYTPACDARGKQIQPTEFQILSVDDIIAQENNITDFNGFFLTNQIGDRCKPWWSDAPAVWDNPEITLANHPALQKLLGEV